MNRQLDKVNKTIQMFRDYVIREAKDNLKRTGHNNTSSLANSLKGRTLILTHRIEILRQNSDWLTNAGTLSSKENTLRYDNEIVIAMVQTLYARIKKENLSTFDNIYISYYEPAIGKPTVSSYTIQINEERYNIPCFDTFDYNHILTSNKKSQQK